MRTEVHELPPGASAAAARLARAVLRPIERFLHVEAASGIVLLVAAVVALAWANSPWRASYAAFWETPIHLGANGSISNVTIHVLINDVLMAIFFFVVGLEIKRELRVGQLSDARRAALPVIAALGGMIAPALIYLALNRGELARGWGVPTATDIAFAVGVLALLGPRVPPSMRVFLLALAIIDDVGAIIAIAVFYSVAIDLEGLAVAAIGIAAIVGLQRVGTRHPIIYGVPAVVVWIGIHHAGIHPTIAGVIVGLLTPAVAWYEPARFVDTARASVQAIEQAPDRAELAASIASLRTAERELASPAERIERALHPWVAFAIMPLFALANAGVDLSGVHLGAAPTVAGGIAAGLVLGKPLGILAASWLAVRLRIASLPPGLTWGGVAVVGTVAGIGFTMALFVAELAFPAGVERGTATLAVLVASGVAATLALVIGRAVATPSRQAP